MGKKAIKSATSAPHIRPSISNPSTSQVKKSAQVEDAIAGKPSQAASTHKTNPKKRNRPSSVSIDIASLLPPAVRPIPLKKSSHH